MGGIVVGSVFICKGAEKREEKRDTMEGGPLRGGHIRRQTGQKIGIVHNE
jgi:hypothetical protein